MTSKTSNILWKPSLATPTLIGAMLIVLLPAKASDVQTLEWGEALSSASPTAMPSAADLVPATTTPPSVAPTQAVPTQTMPAAASLLADAPKAQPEATIPVQQSTQVAQISPSQSVPVAAPTSTSDSDSASIDEILQYSDNGQDSLDRLPLSPSFPMFAQKTGLIRRCNLWLNAMAVSSVIPMVPIVAKAP